VSSSNVWSWEEYGFCLPLFSISSNLTGQSDCYMATLQVFLTLEMNLPVTSVHAKLVISLNSKFMSSPIDCEVRFGRESQVKTYEMVLLCSVERENFHLSLDVNREQDQCERATLLDARIAVVEVTETSTSPKASEISVNKSREFAIHQREVAPTILHSGHCRRP